MDPIIARQELEGWSETHSSGKDSALQFIQRRMRRRHPKVQRVVWAQVMGKNSYIHGRLAIYNGAGLYDFDYCVC